MSAAMNLDSEQPRNLLLDLPAELRNQIYQIVLSSEGPIDASKPIIQPNLTQVCRQTRQESLAWFYTRNLFSIPVCNGDISSLVTFALRTSQRSLYMVRDWGRLRVSIRYSSIFDMPISQSAPDWRQPFTKTLEPAIDFLFEQHMQRDDSVMKDQETGRMLLNWLLLPGVLDKLRQEGRAGPTLKDILFLKIRMEEQLHSVGYNLC